MCGRFSESGGMCGIFGIISDELPSGRVIKEALDSIRYRGPDDEGYVLLGPGGGEALQLSGSDTSLVLGGKYRDVRDAQTSGFNVALANRRLSVIDLSAGGHQPMSYSGGRFWITYNGEIFNYEEIRQELKRRGYRFDSSSDTEVVLAAYQEWGEECVTRFNGQWAFCIYDKGRQSIFCSRDRFGIKPLYYWHDGRTFAFASEIKALLTLPFVSTGINASLVLDYVVFHMHHHTDETVYSSVRQVPPSHNLTFTLQDRGLCSRRYYTLPLNNQMGSYSRRKAFQYADDIRELLVDAVRVRLVSDVDVGSCLSGGLDSSSIVAIISALLRGKSAGPGGIGEMQKTFTASVYDPVLDEKLFAEEMVGHTGSSGRFVYPSGQQLWREADRFLFHHDGIVKSTNIYAGWCVMRLASQHVKVVLNGQGGDELFGGYPRYEQVYASGVLKEGGFEAGYRFISGQRMRYGTSRTVAGLLAGGYLAAVPSCLKTFLFKRRNRIQWERLRELLGGASPRAESFSRMTEWTTSLNYCLWCDLTQGYLRQLLYHDDRNAAAFSIENRVPFLDHRLVEYVSSIPSVYKLYNGWSKWLLRLAMRELLPENILWRKDKIGFATPSRKWSVCEGSPIPQLMRRYGIEEYRPQYLWKFYVAHRLTKS